MIAVILFLYCSPARAETRVILLRGWFGVFSTGLDAIADALKAKGIHAEVAGHLQWKAAADEIRHERAQGKTDAIVLVGHSQGANNVIDMARVLEAQNVPIALLVTLAPYRQDPVPANVMRAINYYQSAGWGALPPLASQDFARQKQNTERNARFDRRPRRTENTQGRKRERDRMCDSEPRHRQQQHRRVAYDENKPEHEKEVVEAEQDVLDAVRQIGAGDR